MNTLGIFFNGNGNKLNAMDEKMLASSPAFLFTICLFLFAPPVMAR